MNCLQLRICVRFGNGKFKLVSSGGCAVEYQKSRMGRYAILFQLDAAIVDVHVHYKSNTREYGLGLELLTSFPLPSIQLSLQQRFLMRSLE